MFTSPGAIAFSTDFFTIYWYGIMLAIALICGFYTAKTIIQKEYTNENKIVDNFYELTFWVILGGLLGARIYYVILGFNYYCEHLLEIFMLQNGGLSIHGGILGGLIGGWICCKIHNFEFLKYADIFALGLPIAQAIGRWGNFFNSEAFGLPTQLPWGVYIPLTSRPDNLAMFEYFHPTFLYESILNIIIFCILYFIIKKYFFAKKGVIFFSYLIMYSFFRILIECIRIDSILNIYGIPVAIWMSLIIILISVFCLIFVLKKIKN